MSDQTCLKRHLLYASVETYHPDGPLYSRARARWIGERPPFRADPPQPVDALEIDFALVGRFEEGIVVAFRGTLPPLDLTPDGRALVRPRLDRFTPWFDWINSLRFQPVSARVAGAALPGKVHRGFAESLEKLWGDVAGEIDRLRGVDPAPRLYFTGHSKGGALANLAAVRAHIAWPQAILRAVTFGAPRAGNATFAQAYEAAQVECHRYEVEPDVVPDFPPANVALGEPHDVPEIRHSGMDLRVFLRGPIGAHLAYRGFGYGEHVCEPGCRHDWR